MQPTIVEHMAGLARQHQALNLRQAFPDEAPLPELIAAATRELAEKSHHYPPAAGLALDDRSFAERAVVGAGAASIPMSALWAGQGPRHLLRLCFTKDAETLVETAKRLGRFRAPLIG